MNFKKIVYSLNSLTEMWDNFTDITRNYKFDAIIILIEYPVNNIN